MPSLPFRDSLLLPYRAQDMASMSVLFPAPFCPRMPMTPSGNSMRASLNLR
ncbi:MAG: hypothetical protein ISF22_04245 [Methanomassiliicoccus sp.]|nr:hypothetical protein [Methanomassiliicoccus sp.]